jgi:hypothetical protein
VEQASAVKQSTKTAAALLALGHIPYEHAKAMSEKEFLALYEWHHGIPRAEDGPDAFWNLTPLLRWEHRERTAKLDVPRIAKNKRVSAKHARHLERMKQKGKE